MIPSAEFTVGNTITVAVAIYKQNWKRFLKLSLIAHLWLLVPVYGWSRYFAIAAWMSNLSLQELDRDSNNLELKYYLSISALFTFLIVGIVAIAVPLILSSILLFFSIVAYVLLENAFFSKIFSVVELSFDWLNSEIREAFLGLSAILFLLIFSILFYGKIFISDSVFTYTKKVFALIKESFIITSKKKQVFLIICQSIIVVLPVWVVGYFTIAIIVGLILWLVETWTSISINISDEQLGLIFFIFLTLFVNLITVPYWQAVKAVTYHNLTHKPNYDLNQDRV